MTPAAHHLAFARQLKLPLEELRRWSRVLLAGMAAEQVVHGGSDGGADDRQLLGRIWGLSGQSAQIAQLEQRRAGAKWSSG